MVTVRKSEHIRLSAECGNITATYNNEFTPRISVAKPIRGMLNTLTMYPADLDDAIEALTVLRDELREQGKV